MNGNPENPDGDKPYRPLPHWGELENQIMTKREILGGMRLDDLPVGRKLEVITENHTYVIERREDGFWMSGDPKRFPKPTRVNIHGSTFGGSMIEEGFIGRDMRLELDHPIKKGQILTTSKIREMRVLPERS